MKIQWIGAALLGTALVVGCGDRSNENTENAPENAGTSVAVAPDNGSQTNLQPPAAEPSLSPNRDASAERAPPAARPTSGTRPAPRTPAPATRANASPAAREDAPRASAPARVVVREVTVPVGTALALELTSPVSSETAQIEMPV